MPRYDVDGRIANISEKSVDEFIRRYPGAKLVDSTPYYLSRPNKEEKPQETMANPNDYIRPLRMPVGEQPRVEFSKPEELFRPKTGQEIVRDNLRNRPVNPDMVFDAQIEQYQREKGEIQAIQNDPSISPEEKKAALDYYNTYVRQGGAEIDRLPASALGWLDRNKIEYDVPVYGPSAMGGGVDLKTKRQNTPEQEELIRDFITNTPEGQKFAREHKVQSEALDSAIDDLKARIEDSEKNGRKVSKSVYLPGSPMFGGGRYVETVVSENHEDIKAARVQLLELERLRDAYNDRALSQIHQFGRELGRRAGDAAINTATLGASRLLMNAGQNKALQNPENELTKEAVDLLDQYQSFHSVDRSVAQDIARATTDNADFIAQFAATGGIASALTKGAATAIGKKLGGTMFAKAVGKMGEDMAAAFVRTSLMPSTLATAYEINSREPGSFLDAYSRAFGQNFIENYTESLGAYLPTKFRFLGKESSWANKIGKHTGFQGALPEFAEEQLATIFHSAAGDGQAQWSDLIDPRNQLVTFGTIGVMQLPYTAINAGGYAAGKFHNVKQKRSITKGYQANLKNMGLQFGKDMEGVIDFINQKIDADTDGTSIPALVAIAGSEAEMTDKQKDALIEYGLAYLAYFGLNKAKSEEITEAAQGVATLLEDNVNPKTGSIMTAVIGGLESPVQIMDGRIVVREDGSIDREKSDQQIFYNDPEGNRKVTSINLVESMVESIPAQEAIALATEQVSASIVAQQENEEVRPYEAGEVVRVATSEGSMTGQIIGVDETSGNYILSVETPMGLMQQIVEPRQIINEDNIQGIENGMTVSYVGANDQIIEGVVEDAYTRRAEGLFFIDGELIPIANIIGPASEAMTPEQITPQGATEQVGFAEQVQPVQTNAEYETALKNTPRQTDGEIDYDALLTSNPNDFAILYEREVGEEDAATTLRELSEGLGKELGAKTKSLSKTTEINKKVKIRKEINTLKERKANIDNLINDRYQARAVEPTQSVSPVVAQPVPQKRVQKPKSRTPLQRFMSEFLPSNLYEAALIHLMQGGQFSRDDFFRMTGYSAKDLGAASFLLTKNGEAFDMFEAEYYSNNRPDQYDAGFESNLEDIVDAINTYIEARGSKYALMEILQDNASKEAIEAMAESIEEPNQIEENVPDEVIEAFQLPDAVHDFINEYADKLRDVSSYETTYEEFEAVLEMAKEEGIFVYPFSPEYYTEIKTYIEDAKRNGKSYEEAINRPANTGVSSIPVLPMEERTTDRGNNAGESRPDQSGSDKDHEAGVGAENSRTAGGIRNEAQPRTNRRGGDGVRETGAGEGSSRTADEERIVDEANSALDAEIADVTARLQQKRAEYKAAKTRIGNAFTEDNQTSLFPQERASDNLFDVPRDFSQSNVEDILGPIRQEIGVLENQLTELENSRESRVNRALDNLRSQQTIFDEIARAESETDTNPTEAQKEAGNYKKGKVTIQGFDISIEQPKGSERSGIDENGNPWSVTMNNTYGYIRKTEGKDGEHIDVFLGDNPESATVFVVDQVNPNTGQFDEHKVMLGFNSLEEAHDAYLSNYEEGWLGLGSITGVEVETFRNWTDTEGRRVKPFSEYREIQDAFEDDSTPFQSVSAKSHFKPIGRKKFEALIGRLVKSGLAKDVVTDKTRFDAKLDMVINGSTMRENDIKFQIRNSPPPKKTKKGYKVFVVKDGKLYPPMVNPTGQPTPIGVWLDAEEGQSAGVSKTGRPQVKMGGKGTQGGSGTLAFRPGWHLGELPRASQFDRLNQETGRKELMPENFVWAEVEYADDIDYQNEAMSYGQTANGKFNHALQGDSQRQKVDQYGG